MYQTESGFCMDGWIMIISLVGGGFVLLAIFVLILYCIDKGCKSQKMNVDEKIINTMLKYGLQRGPVLGYGSYGKVYQGYWTPRDGVITVGRFVKVPVAIKYLNKKLPNDERTQILDEMFSLSNEHILKPLIVCSDYEQVMLVNPLLPLGNLLNYVQKNKENISTKHLLEWSLQIAQGMAYLEDLGIVHGDLATRNTMVKSPTSIKINFDGLSKVHYILNDHCRKWLSPESLKTKTFTIKSDVWSFGITAWELLTFGGDPWKNTWGYWSNLENELDNGDRLPQPAIATNEVFHQLLKCWIYEPDRRPSFKELVDVFSNMVQTPDQYLILPEPKSKYLPTSDPEMEKLLPCFFAANIGGSEEVMTADEYLEKSELSSYTTSVYWENEKPIYKRNK